MHNQPATPAAQLSNSLKCVREDLGQIVLSGEFEFSHLHFSVCSTNTWESPESATYGTAQIVVEKEPMFTEQSRVKVS